MPRCQSLPSVINFEESCRITADFSWNAARSPSVLAESETSRGAFPLKSSYQSDSKRQLKPDRYRPMTSNSFSKHITTYWIFKEYHYHPLENHMEMHMAVCGMENLNLLSRWWQARCTKTVYLSIWLAAPVSLDPSHCSSDYCQAGGAIWQQTQPEHESTIYVQLKWVMFVQFQRWRWSNWVQLSTYTVSRFVFWACCCLTWFDSVII